MTEGTALAQVRRPAGVEPDSRPYLFIWLGTRSALRALRPKRCCATFGPLPSPASPRPCRGSPSTEGLVPPATAVDPRHAWMTEGTASAQVRRPAGVEPDSSPFYLSGWGRDARSARLAGLSPPLSGQPLNRGACSPRYDSRSTPCVDASARSHRLPARGRACRRPPPWRPHLSLNSWFKAS